MPSTATTRTVTGLTNGTAYQFRVAAVNALGTGAYSTASATVTPSAAPTDPDFASVSLLLPFDGTLNAFVDASATPKDIVALGNATQSADQSKWGGKSLRLANTGDYLTFTGVPSIGTGNFCVELWAYSAWSGPMMLWDFRPHGQLAIWTDNTLLNVAYGAAFGPRGTLTANQWQHIALTRSGTTLRLFIDGLQTFTTTFSDNVNTAGGTNFIGKAFDADWSAPNFWMDDFRLSTVARYTEDFGDDLPAAAFPTS